MQLLHIFCFYSMQKLHVLAGIKGEDLRQRCHRGGENRSVRFLESYEISPLPPSCSRRAGARAFHSERALQARVRQALPLKVGRSCSRSDEALPRYPQ